MLALPNVHGYLSAYCRLKEQSSQTLPGLGLRRLWGHTLASKDRPPKRSTENKAEPPRL